MRAHSTSIIPVYSASSLKIEKIVFFNVRIIEKLKNCQHKFRATSERMRYGHPREYRWPGVPYSLLLRSTLFLDFCFATFVVRKKTHKPLLQR